MDGRHPYSLEQLFLFLVYYIMILYFSRWGCNTTMRLRLQLSQYTSVFATHILPAVQFRSRKQDGDTRPSKAACTSVSGL